MLCDPGRKILYLFWAALCSMAMREASRLCATQQSTPTSLAFFEIAGRMSAIANSAGDVPTFWEKRVALTAVAARPAVSKLAYGTRPCNSLVIGGF